MIAMTRMAHSHTKAAPMVRMTSSGCLATTVTMSTAYGANAAASTPEKESKEAEDARDGIYMYRLHFGSGKPRQVKSKSSQVKLPVFPLCGSKTSTGKIV